LIGLKFVSTDKIAEAENQETVRRKRFVAPRPVMPLSHLIKRSSSKGQLSLLLISQESRFAHLVATLFYFLHLGIMAVCICCVPFPGFSTPFRSTHFVVKNRSRRRKCSRFGRFLHHAKGQGAEHVVNVKTTTIVNKCHFLYHPVFSE
jgi:hypothetical protein